MTHLLAFAAGIAAGVYLGLRLVYDREPATEPEPEGDDWATDPRTFSFFLGGVTPDRPDVKTWTYQPELATEQR